MTSVWDVTEKIRQQMDPFYKLQAMFANKYDWMENSAHIAVLKFTYPGLGLIKAVEEAHKAVRPFMTTHEAIINAFVPFREQFKIYEQLGLSEKWLRVAEHNEIEFEVDVNLEERVDIISPGDAAIYAIKAEKISNLIRGIQCNRLHLKSLTPTQFEDMVAALLYKLGYEVKQSKRTRDGGYDILASVQDLDNTSLKYLVQCKHPQKLETKIAVGVIREFKSVITENSANKGLFITSSFFSRDAIKDAQTFGTRLALHDFNAVMKWILEY